MKIENTNFVDYLIELSKEGRKRAFLDLCEINLRNIFTVIYRLVADYETTKAITLKTFFSAWDNIKDYSAKFPYSLWIKNLAITHAIKELKLSNARESNSAGKIKYSTDLELLELMIQSLPPDERIIFVLHDLEGYSYQEIKVFLSRYEIDEIKTMLLNTRRHLMEGIGL